MVKESHKVDAVANDGKTAVTGSNSDPDVDKAADVGGKSASFGVTDAYIYSVTLPGGMALVDSHSVGIRVVVRGGAIIAPDHFA